MSTTINLGKIMPTYEGEYSPTKDYEKLSIVSYQGSSYISRTATQGTAPAVGSAIWQLIAKKGDSITYADLSDQERADLRQEAVAAAQQATQAMQSVFDRIEDFDLSNPDDALLALEAEITAANTRTSFVRGYVSLESDLDDLCTLAHIGLYYYRGAGWKGPVSVQFDAQNTVSQLALSSATPSYAADGGLSWLSAQPCLMRRIYSGSAWGRWELASSSGVAVADASSTADLEIADDAGNVLVRFHDGHIQTALFDSSDLDTPADALTALSVDQPSATAATITATKGSGATTTLTIPAATTARAGLLSAADKARLDNLASPWAGKKIGALGDSITEGYNTTRTYLQYLADLTGCTTYNYGLGGSRIAEVSGDSVQSFVERASTVRTDLDVLLVFGGINDFYWSECYLGDQYTVSTSTGAFTLNTDTSTFHGAYNTIMQTLISRLPTARIILLTPIHAGRFSTGTKSTWMRNAKGLTLMDFIAAVKAVGLLWGVPVIDMASQSGLNPNVTASQQAYFNHNVPSTSNPDYLHPDANGHLRIAQTILRHL